MAILEGLAVSFIGKVAEKTGKFLANLLPENKRPAFKPILNDAFDAFKRHALNNENDYA